MRELKFKWNISIDKIRIPVILALTVLFALFIRLYWGIGPSIANGYAVSGGSDSYYHERIISYILSHHQQLLKDPMLNYPLGAINPRPPLFHWAIVMLGYVFSPFIGEYHGAILSLIIFPAIWGSLSVLVVYLLAKEAFNKRIGLLAALFMAIMPGAITRSIVTQADWDAFDLFFILLIFYFFLRALKKVQYKYWIRDWFKKNEVKSGLSEFFKENKESVVYAALSGMALAALALAWKGYTYGLTILLLYLFIQIFINRFRNRSNLHIIIFLLFFMVIGFGLSFPWYFITHRIPVWFDVPFMLTVAVLGLGLFLEVTGKYPWPLVFSLTAILIVAASIIIQIVSPDTWGWIISGQGYFVKNKLYSTIAEAQPASLGYLSMSYGVAIFLLAFGGVAYMIYLIRKSKHEYYIFFVLYSVISMYMAMSAARFIFNASPAFAIGGAVAVAWLIDTLHFRETFEELKKYKGGLKKTFKESFKVSQVSVALLLAFLLIVPTVWSAVDAGIPYEDKNKFDKQIYNIMPSFMKPNETAYKKSAPWYLGAFGYSLPKSDYPWQRAWKWLSEQDNSTPPFERPGFVSWWDYGFQAIREGEHPALADNFQNGYQMAAQIITAQNESQVIALFAIRLMEGDYNTHHNFSQGMMSILHKYFTNEEVKKIIEAMKNPGQFKSLVLSNPDYYGYYINDISDENVKYAFLKALFAHHRESMLVNLYDSIRNYTHKDLRYFAIDYRLFPFSGRDTGIFYAPAELGGRRIEKFGGTVVPYDFYTLKAVDQYGNEYALNKVPANVHIVNYKISYKPMFYNSMLYRTFIGYPPQEVGSNSGIPGISPNLYRYNPMQAWDMAHFKLVYRTAYWNPYKDYQNHTSAWEPIPIELALKYKNEHKGTVELYPPAYRILPNDVVIVKFYEGAVIEGHIRLSTGEPLKHIRVTLLDEYGIPHTSVFTNKSGFFKLDAVAGNLTLVASTNGKLNKLTLTEQTKLFETHIHVSEAQAERLVPNITIVKNIVVKPSNLDGVVYYDLNKDNKFDSGDMKLKSGEVVLENDTYGYKDTGKIQNGLYTIHDIPPHKYTVSLILNGRYFKGFKNITMGSGQNLTHDIAITPSFVDGNVTYANGKPAAYAKVYLEGDYSNFTAVTGSNGSFRVMVVPDNYTVVARNGSYVSDKSTVIVNLWNYTTSVNMTLKHAFKMSGVLEYNGEIMPNTVIKISSDLRPYDNYIFMTGRNGEFSLDLPGGFYTIYTTTFANGVRVSYLKFINLNHNISINMNLEKAYRISGYVTNSNSIKNAEIGVYGKNILYRAYANATGYYEVYLPEGRYILGVVGYDSNLTPYFARRIVDLHDNLVINPTLQKAYNVTGYVYYSSDGGNQSSILRNGLVFLYDSQGVYEIRNIPPDGRFSLPTTIDYKIKVMVWGYNQTEIKMGAPVHVTVAPRSVEVKGYLFTNNKLNNMPVNLIFKSANNTYIFKGVTSNYDVYLLPGQYNVSLGGYNRTYTLKISNVRINVGYAMQSFNITFSAYAQVMIVSQATSVTWFHNGLNYTTGKSLKLPVGNYTVYARNATEANMTYVSVTENTTIEVLLMPAIYVYPQILNTSLQLKVRISSEDAQISVSNSAVILPYGKYNFTVNSLKNENGTYFLYHGYNNTILPDNGVVSIWITKTKMMSHISGTVRINNGIAPNCVVNFIASGKNNTNLTVSTDSSGHFAAYIKPGSYLIYSYYIEGTMLYSYLSKVTVSGNYMHLLIQMKNGYLVNGRTYRGQKEIPVTVRIASSAGTLSVHSTGYYWSILPSGNYTVSAQIVRTEYGQGVVYFYHGNMSVTSNINYDIHLQRNNLHMLSLKVMAVSNYAKPNQTIGVTLLVGNKGNAVENIHFEGVNGWTVKNSGKYIIYPGDSKMVSLSVSVPQNAKYGKNSFQLRAVFSGLLQTVSINTNVTAMYATSVNESKVNWINGSIVYVVGITNNGNRWVNYTLSILNTVNLQDKGWKEKIVVNGHVQNWINVSAGAKHAIKIVVEATQSTPSTVEPLILLVHGHKEYIKKIPLYFPELSPTTLYVKSDNVHNYTGMETPSYFYWVWGLVAVLAALIGIEWRRRR